MNKFFNKINRSLRIILVKVGFRLIEIANGKQTVLDNRFQKATMADSLYRLRQRGVKLDYVVDIGANVGKWSQLLKSIYPEAKVLMIEPQSKHKDCLENICNTYSGYMFSPSLLGASQQDEIEFYITDDGHENSGSSVFRENSNVPANVNRIPMTTLDNIIVQSKLGFPNFIKLDVQGYELEVLKGAEDTIKSVDFILLEVSIWPYNVGGPLIDEVIAWMDSKNFVTYDLCEVHRRNDGVLLQIDILFIPRQSVLLENTITIYSDF